MLCAVFAGISSVQAQNWTIVIDNTTPLTNFVGTANITGTALYIAPNAVININGNGVMNINAEIIYIAPGAKIGTSGNGVINLNGLSGQPIYLDANGVKMNANFRMRNPKGLILVDYSGGMLTNENSVYGATDNPNNCNFETSGSFSLDSGNVLLNQYIGGTFFSGTLNIAGPGAYSVYGNISNDFIMDSVNVSGRTRGFLNYGPPPAGGVSGWVVTNNGMGNSSTLGGHVVANFVDPATVTGATLPASFTFPVGIDASDTSYTPAQVTTSVPNNIHVTVQNFATSAPNPHTNNGMNRVWNIYADNATTGEYTINLQHNDATNQSAFEDDKSFVTQWSNTAPNTSGTYAGAGVLASQWQSNNVTTVSTGNLQNSGGDMTGTSMTASDGITNYTALATSPTAATAYFSKSSSNIAPLPVSLTAFNAYKQNGSSLLQWTTASEINSKGFGIQRSTDSKTWNSIGFVNSQAANGNSSAALSYSYTDNNPANGINYYRLQEEGLSGNTAYSSVASVDFGVKATVYPIPASTQLNVTVGANSNYQLINILGKTVSEGSLNAGSNIIGVSNVPSGTYLLRLSANGSTSTYKVLIER